MSQGIFRLALADEVNARMMVALQGCFKELGGRGSVATFLERAARDANDGHPLHFGNMTARQRRIWRLLPTPRFVTSEDVKHWR